MYTLTIQCLDFESLKRTVEALNALPVQLVEAKAEIPASKKPAKKEASPEPEAQEETSIDFSAVKAAVLNVAKDKGREASLDLLAKFGVVTGEGENRKGDMKALKEEQYAAVVAEAKKVLNEKESN
jgi:hypothetical protein